jgi:hypothetical protein
VQAPKFSPGTRVSTSFGPGVVEAYRSDDKIYTILVDADDDAPRSRSYLTEEGIGPFRPKYPVGSRVQTPYGHGVIESYRDEDKIYGVKYIWDDNGGAVGYLPKESIEPYVEQLNVQTIPVASESQDVKRSGSKFPASGEEAGVQEWLATQGYDEQARSRLKGYNGARLFGETKKEIMALVGGREGLRLFNTLHPEGSEEVKSGPASTSTSTSNAASRSLPEPDKQEDEEGDEEEDEEEEEEGEK